jgi:hypothetical protein
LQAGLSAFKFVGFTAAIATTMTNVIGQFDLVWKLNHSA